MEEELERRRKWMRERRGLSAEERKRRSREYEKRKKREYLELSPEIILAEAEVDMSLVGILAGLMFTASVLFISFGRALLYGDIFVAFTLVDTFFFVLAALMGHFHVTYVRRREMYDAYHYHILSSTFGTIGSLLMLGGLPLMAFLIRWELGIIVSVVGVLSFSYIGYRMLKHLFSFGFETS